MHLKLFHYEIRLFDRNEMAPRTQELAELRSAELVRALGESRTLLDDVFAQPDLETGASGSDSVNPVDCPQTRSCPLDQSCPPPRASPQE
ncbi:hypothetical protein D9M71_413360 [compost metagenome]